MDEASRAGISNQFHLPPFPTGFDSSRSTPLVVLSNTSSGPAKILSLISFECSLCAQNDHEKVISD